MLDVNRILRQYSSSADEQEFAVTEGIPWNQIIGWQRVFDTELLMDNVRYEPFEWINLTLC